MSRILRALPFALFACLGLYAASRAPRGRHPFAVDLGLTWADFAQALSKVQHIRAYAVLLLLAVVAFGVARLAAAFGTTMALGLACELLESTAIGHHARLADLAPNLVGGLISVLLVVTVKGVLSGDGASRGSAVSASRLQ